MTKIQICYMGPLDTIEDPYSSNIDILIRLNDQYSEEDSDFCYLVEVATPNGLVDLMKKRGMTYFPPMPPFIIIEKLTKENIDAVIKAFVEEQDDAYWLKVYYLASEFNIDELNATIERRNKEMKEERNCDDD